MTTSYGRVGRVVQGFPIQLAKVQPPPLRAATLHRERLFNWLDEHVQRRLLLLTAEAGFGKTTLLADWARRAPVRVAWYRIEDDDANWASFLRYLVAAGREIDPDFGQLTSVLLDELAAGAKNRDVVRATFFREIEELAAARRIVFILDDTHLLRKIRDVVTLLSDLINKGPASITWILSARRRTGVSIGKLRAVGEMQELRRDDLKFQVDECTELFATTFERPMTADLVHTVIRRTEGWAASLQLVNTATRDRSDAERRAFIRSLSGARGEVYDYLAEEVVGDLESNLQDVLMRASIMRVVTVPNVELVTGLSPSDAAAALDEVVPLGLLDPVGPEEPDAYRYHPLVREFLEARLRQECGDDYVTDLHRRLAVAHEGIDWRTSAHHYEAIHATEDLQRVLIDSAPTIMARGEFDIAKKYAEPLLGSATQAIRLFASRVALDENDMEGALEHARAAYEGTPEHHPLRALALANRVAIAMNAGAISEAMHLNDVLIDSGPPQLILDIAVASRFHRDVAAGAPVDAYQRHLHNMERSHRASSSTHYLGVTLLNSGVVARLRGQADVALAKSAEAMSLLRAGSRRNEHNAAQLNHAWAQAHLGNWTQAVADIAEAVTRAEGIVRNEAWVEAAEIWLQFADEAGASQLLDRIQSDETPSKLANAHLDLLFAALRARQGRADEARQFLSRPTHPDASMSIDDFAFRQFLDGWISFLEHGRAAEATIRRASESVRLQRADLFGYCLDVLLAATHEAARGNEELLRVGLWDPTYLSVMAEVVCGFLEAAPDALLSLIRQEVVARPDRWRDPLRAYITREGPGFLKAAELLESIGSREDVALLRRIGRSRAGRRTHRGLGQGLARRLAARLFVEDLGRVRLRLGDRDLEDLDPRRKVLELVCFLLTRTDLSATRDEVVDAIWPETDPSSASNSLNQTLYFLRRVIEPNYTEELSPAYVHHDSDVLWLDRELVSSRSIRSRRILRSIETSHSLDSARDLAAEYTGKFALDFSYEDWAAGFRDHLHASYLRVIEAAIRSELKVGRPDQAIALAARALEIDPQAEQIERLLVRGYVEGGAHAAAREQYAHYAAAMRNELGVEPPSLSELLTEGFDPTIDT